MGSVNRPPGRRESHGPRGAHDARATPRRTRDDGGHAGEPWQFDAEVRQTGGEEGAWLRGELTAVLGDLLAWAHEDMSAAASADPVPEERDSHEQS